MSGEPHPPTKPSAAGEGPPDSSGRDPAPPTGEGWPMILLRYGLPGAVVLGGLIVMSLGSEPELEGGAGILSAGLAIYFINWLFRAGVAGDREREAEDRARDHFDRHGRWPD